MRAIRDLEADGIPVLVATGRRLRMACAVLEAGGLTGPAVVLDGAIGSTCATGGCSTRSPSRPRQPARVLEAFVAAGLSPCVYVDRAGVDLVVGDHPLDPPRPPGPGPALGGRRRSGPRGRGREPVYAFAVVGRPAPLLGPVLGVVGPSGSACMVDDLIYGGSTVQVRPPEISKWSGVLAYCAEQGLDPGRVLAVGDGANDLELLEGAAVACVVPPPPRPSWPAPTT